MECPTCHRETEDVATKLDVADKWWAIEDLGKGETTYLWEPGLTVEMIEPPTAAEYDSYGETTSEAIHMVVKVDGRYFKKDGFRSSYGGTEWNGSIREVKAKPRTVTVYDYA